MKPEDNNVLCSDGDYTITHSHEDAFLIWPADRLVVGDHYGNPTCAIINLSDNWCLTGGEGLVICRFEDGFPSGAAPSTLARMTVTELWRRANPPADGSEAWDIEGAWLFEGDIARILVDPLSPNAGLYEVDVRTLAWRRM